MAAIHLHAGHGTAGARDHRRAGLDALSDATAWVLSRVREWRRRRRERAELASLDARRLADIGLSRGEAEFLANKPFWRE